MGDSLRRENGGWPPHVHYQLSMRRPRTHDLPGVVSFDDVTRAQDAFPDPRLVLGPLSATSLVTNRVEGSDLGADVTKRW
ncbi:hypothetical protein EMIHUDRAFT_226078 [Emiliania huxleyi CCMP1516]|uniref:Peptidase M23 domain-containing protein n=2 Tax=Emiliania huxleyi TaxID=2903 RepID=A0A0D3KLF6_EMIH1|nr:hypothetical protein EMIHUDRAFT_226078 [Emiliania huxleyi CCMP1516]EOD36591.1 hypothetical protein EMIHUDRAFT_226078 [Emiliania huxleyi CCMP1516]|eukprot:XP_005789020.1 hypothetical protein EMIHUDRAFT_226078 [Emiliania huxleyi CCMP1516]